MSAPLSLAVCVCVCVLPVSLNGCSMLAKICLYGIEHLQSNDASPVFLLYELDLQFHGQTFCILFDLRISREW